MALSVFECSWSTCVGLNLTQHKATIKQKKYTQDPKGTKFVKQLTPIDRVHSIV